MPEALATSKRKFYKILDSLSSPAPPSHSTGTGHPNPLVPKSRLHGRSALRSSLNLGTASTVPSPQLRSSSADMADLRARLGVGASDKRISMVSTPATATAAILKPTNPILHKTGSFASLRSLDKENDRGQLKEATPLPEKGLPAFCPWSHDAFLDRLKTFAPVTNWLPKPADEVSEVAWAKRGWSCGGIETVVCAACKKRLVVDFNPAKYGRESKRRRVRIEDDGDSDKIEKTGTVLTDDGKETPLVSQDELATRDQDDEDDDPQDADDDDALDEYEYEEAFEKGLVEKYKVLIVDGHGTSCPWRQAGCKDDIYRIPVVRREWWQKHISKAFLAALSMSEDIGRLDLREISIKPTAEKILRNMPPGFFSTAQQSFLFQPPNSRPATPRLGTPRAERVVISRPGSPGQTSPAGSRPSSPKGPTKPAPITDPENTFSKAIQARALTIALTGWIATTESSTNLLSCSACFQRVGLWLYQGPEKPSADPHTRTDSGHHDTDDEADDDADTTNNDSSSSSPTTLDLISQHREHCPFRNSLSQLGTGDFSGFPAWIVLWTTVARWADEQRRRSALPVSPSSPSFPGSGLGYSALIEGPYAGRAETEKLDKERTTKLRKLRKALGIFRVPGLGGKEKEKEKGGGDDKG